MEHNTDIEEYIPTLDELLDMCDAGKLEGNYFKAYPTKLHRDLKSCWWFPRIEVEASAKQRKEGRINYLKAIWST